MTALASEKNDIERFLAGYASDVTKTAEALRALMQRLVPDSVEKLHSGWKVISYKQDKHLIASIAPHSKWVNLQFMQGTSLPDPTNLLEGTGKTMRHVKLSRAAELSADVEQLVIESIALGGETS